MCQDCHGTSLDDDLGYDDLDDDWGDDGLDDDWGDDGYDDPGDYYDPHDDREPDEPDWGYQEWLAAEERHFEEKHPDGSICNCKPPLRDRIRWLISAWTRRLDMKRHPDRYYDEPPF